MAQRARAPRRHLSLLFGMRRGFDRTLQVRTACCTAASTPKRNHTAIRTQADVALSPACRCSRQNRKIAPVERCCSRLSVEHYVPPVFFLGVFGRHVTLSAVQLWFALDATNLNTAANGYRDCCRWIAAASGATATTTRGMPTPIGATTCGCRSTTITATGRGWCA